MFRLAACAACGGLILGAGLVVAIQAVSSPDVDQARDAPRAAAPSGSGGLSNAAHDRIDGILPERLAGSERLSWPEDVPGENARLAHSGASGTAPLVVSGAEDVPAGGAARQDPLARIDRALAALEDGRARRLAQHIAAFADIAFLVELKADGQGFDATARTRFFDAGLRSLHRFNRYHSGSDRPEAGAAVPGFLAAGIDGAYVVESVVRGGPADRGGLRPGDRIVSIDGVDVRREDAATINAALESLLRDADGRDALALGIEAPGRAEELVMPLDADGQRALGVYDLGRRDGVLYLRVHAFEAGGAARLAALIDRHLESASAPVTGVVLDLRGRPGGRLDTAAAMLDLFLPRDALLYEVSGRARGTRRVRAQDAARFGDLGVAVLVDGRTASAAEVLAAGMHAHGPGVVMGWTTRGKGSVQTIFPVRGADVRLTVARLRDAALRELSGSGVTPEADPGWPDPGRRPSRFEDDRLLELAVARLTGR